MTESLKQRKRKNRDLTPFQMERSLLKTISKKEIRKKGKPERSSGISFDQRFLICMGQKWGISFDYHLCKVRSGVNFVGKEISWRCNCYVGRESMRELYFPILSSELSSPDQLFMRPEWRRSYLFSNIIFETKYSILLHSSPTNIWCGQLWWEYWKIEFSHWLSSHTSKQWSLHFIYTSIPAKNPLDNYPNPHTTFWFHYVSKIPTPTSSLFYKDQNRSRGDQEVKI